MPALSKTVTILNRIPGQSPSFQQSATEPRGHFVIIDEGVDKDMGHPDTITVTIEPGDRLN